MTAKPRAHRIRSLTYKSAWSGGPCITRFKTFLVFVVNHRRLKETLPDSVRGKRLKSSETSSCSQFCLFAIFGEFIHDFGWVFAVLFEVVLIQIQEEIHHFAGWEVQHETSWGINSCNVRFGAVIPWKPQIFRLQLQFFSWRCVGISCCNVSGRHREDRREGAELLQNLHTGTGFLKNPKQTFLRTLPLLKKPPSLLENLPSLLKSIDAPFWLTQGLSKCNSVFFTGFETFSKYNM